MPRMVANYKSYERMAAMRLGPEHFMNAWSESELEAIQAMITERYNDTWTGMLASSEAARDVMGRIESLRPWTAAKVFDRYLTLYFKDITNLLKESDVMEIMFNWITSLLKVIEDEDAKQIRAQFKQPTQNQRRQRHPPSEKEYWDEMTAFESQRQELGPSFPGDDQDD